MWRFINGKWVLFAPETGSGSGDDPQDDNQDDGNEPEPEDDSQDDADDPQDDNQDDGNEPEPEDDSQDDADDEQDPPAPVRRENRFQRQANELRETREELRRTNERLSQFEASRNQSPNDAAEERRREEEKLRLMDPTERETYLLKKEVQDLKRGQQAAHVQMQEATDKSGFEAAARVDPVRKKYEARVNQMHEDYLRKGTWVPRETAFTYLLGEDAKKRLEAAARNPKGQQRKREQAQQRVESSKGVRVTARSDGGRKSSGKGDDLASLEARLKGVQL